MESLNNYLDYRKHKKEYAPWKKDREEQEGKRIEYIKQNGISEAQKQTDIKRAKAILNAVNIMDEFSQTRAEDMEVATQTTAGTVVNLLTEALLAGTVLISSASKKIRTSIKNLAENGAKAINIKNLAPLLLPVSAFIIGSSFIYGKANAWSAKKEMQASREGRYEAINNDLKSTNNFAVLTEEQEKEVNEIAKNIKINKKEAKKADKANKDLGIMTTIKTMFRHDGEIEIEHLAEKRKLVKANNNVALSDKDLEEAKKDKQLISNIVEKIDIASQEYAENVELATGTVQAITFGLGGGIGATVHKILKHFKFSNEATPKVIAWICTMALPLVYAFMATKVQKQASRVARFKAKQDLINNPEQLIYVDDEKIKNIDGTKNTKKKENKNYFKFVVDMFKNNAEYEKYTKENSVKNLQRAKALSQVKLTKEQENRAKQLRDNVIMTFNEVDENSQKYSESTEALGETVQATIGSIGGLLSMPFTMNLATSIGKMNTKKKILNLIGMIVPLGISIVANIFITKEQKNASKVANMLAIKGLDDNRNFVDYSNLSKDEVTIKGNKAEIPAYIGHSDLFNKFMQQRNTQ